MNPRYRRLTFLLFIFFTFSLTSCVKRQFHGVKPSEGLTKGGLFVKVASCTPILQWEKSPDTDTSYDVSVFKAVSNRAVNLPERGEQVLYTEGLQTNSLQVSPSLIPRSKYFWSVRKRKPNGEVTGWATYDRDENQIIGWEWHSNLWFGIETPDCGGQAVSSAQTDQGLEKKIYTDRILTDKNLKTLLDGGYGGIVVFNRAYSYNRGDNFNQYKDFADWARHEAAPARFKRLTLNIIIPGKDEEKSIEPNENSLFIFMAPPGEYTISRFMCTSGTGTSSERIFGKVSIEGKKIKYIGDAVTFFRKNLIGGAKDCFVTTAFNPDEFQKYVQQYYPLSSSWMIPEKIAHEPETQPLNQ